jgi:uncharacterized protein
MNCVAPWPLIRTPNVLCLRYHGISEVHGMEHKPKKGFALMSRDQRRKVARWGGIAAHQSGNCHEWNSEEARMAGRKGARARRKTAKA